MTQALMSVESAQRELAATVLFAHASGIVTAVNAKAGQSVGTVAISTLSYLEQRMIQFWVEEADLSSMAVGNPVEIVFEAIPD